ncbi:hypothetical protein ANCCAN_24389 [Ancylostoma caninum]|uniref:Uncharacterized protein n=1 Tax=Ancylostoma caninum TaxID=29170 RepID=A0A368FCF3_ANCCA|nr:hypothetical protein ANCCAN_24389 [Ancylostoma caninum]
MIRSRLPKLEVPGLPFHDYFFKTTRKFAEDVAMRLWHMPYDSSTFRSRRTICNFVTRCYHVAAQFGGRL